MVSRLTEIRIWLTELFPEKEIVSLKYIESDASARKYLRCTLGTEQYIIMDTTPGQEQINFTKIAKLFAANKINAPQIISNNLEQGLMLMNDFGNKTYLATMNETDIVVANKLYQDALTALLKIQRISTKSADIPTMDNAYIEVRLQVFSEWYLQQHLKITVDNDIKALLLWLNKVFTEVFYELPQVVVHVDYHCRNLMHITDGDNPGILDFQDAMIGPITYDLVSLFQDAYITWPRKQVEQWLRVYYDKANALGLLQNQPFEAFLRNFDLVGLQRHLKNLGVFARLHHRDNKSAYLDSIPCLLSYITGTCSRYAELAALEDFLKENVLEKVPS